MAIDDASSVGIGLAVSFLIAGLLIGFLLGTRARQVIASVTALGTAVKKVMSMRIPASAAVIGAAVDAGADDNEKEDEDDDRDKETEIDDFIHAVDADTSLSDHPDVHLSPVILYQIKRSKEEMRLNQRRAALASEGLTNEEVEEQMLIEGAGGGGAGGRMNALALLVACGARVEPTKGGDSAEHAAAQDRKRIQRNIDAYLKKVNGVEKLEMASLESTTPTKGRRDPTGSRMKSAHEVANETANQPFGGETFARSVRNLDVARTGRKAFRKWGRDHPDPLPGTLDLEGEDEEALKLGKGRKKRPGGGGIAGDVDAEGEGGGGGGLDPSMLEGLMENDAEEDVMEDGEEEEEQGEDGGDELLVS